MLRRRPDLVEQLYQPFHFSRQGEESPEQAPYYAAPVFGMRDGHFTCRHVRNHIRGAQNSFAELPRLTPLQVQALDLLDETLARDDLRHQMELHPGDMQFLNNHIVLHARTEYQDHDEPQRKRHLLRLWVAIPEGQPLPEAWQDAYMDVRPGSVRGGILGTGMTPQALQFQARLAAEHGMHCAAS